MFNIGPLELKNRLVLAPMAGITNLPFRLIVKRFGAGLVTTEMISAMGLNLSQPKTLDYLNSHPDEKPLSVQIFGSRPEIMARAAEIVVESGADVVDINMGCPVKKVVKTGAGGALLQSPQRAREVVAAVRGVCPVPLTVKIRAGWSPAEPTACEFARLIQETGADAITVHPRFVTQGFSGKADWRIITEVKERLEIPVIGNGDVLNAADALRMRAETGCDAVMIGRAAVANPWIFRQCLDLAKDLPAAEPDMDERRTLIEEHFRYLSVSAGEKRAVMMMRGLLLRYTKGLPHSAAFRGKIIEIKDFETLAKTLDHYFSVLGDKDS